MRPVPGKYIYSPSDITSIKPMSEMKWCLSLLSSNWYLPIFELLKRGESSAELASVEETYRLLREYYARGAEDPDRRSYIADIGSRLSVLIHRRMERETMEQEPDNLWVRTKHALDIRGLVGTDAMTEVVEELSRRRERDSIFYTLVEDLFDMIWTSNQLSAAEAELLSGLIRDAARPRVGRVVISALMVGGALYFDPRKIRLLFTGSLQKDNPAVQGAATPALLLLSRHHQDLINAIQPALADEIRRAAVENRDFNSAILLATLELHNSYCTAEDHRLFRDKILPQLQNLMSNLGQTPGNTMAEQMENLQKQMQENNTEELEGMIGDFMGRLTRSDYMEHDLEYHSVSMMKQGSFFQKPVNWFILYDEAHPELTPESVEAMNALSRVIFQEREIISSDLYSYATQLNWSQVRQQLEQMGAPLDGGPRHTPGRDLRSYMRDFIFGAYRFYTLFSQREWFDDLFATKAYVLDGALTQVPQLLSEEEYERLAERLSKQRHYANAAYTYARLIQEYGRESAMGWRMIAVADMDAGRKRDALHALDKAIALEGPTPPTVKNKVKVLQELRTNHEAIKMLRSYLETMEISTQEDFDLSRMLLELLLQDEQNEEALQVAYKLDYLADELPSAGDTRALLISLLLRTGRATEAVEKLDSIPEFPELAGLVQLAAGNRTEGVRLLSEWYRKKEADRSKLPDLLDRLSPYDLPKWEIGLIMDTVSAATDADQ